MFGLNKFEKLRDVEMTPTQLIEFESNIADEYERGKIKGPIHLSDGNEVELIEIFQKISKNDLVFSAWRNHYHALLHGVSASYLEKEIRR